MRGELIRSLLSRGVAVSAIVPHDKAVSKLEAMGVEIFDWHVSAHGMTPLSEWRGYRQLKDILRETRPDIVFSFTIKPVIYASMAAHQVGIKRVFSMVPGRGYVFGDTSLLPKVLKSVVTPVYRRALTRNRRVFFQNTDDRDFFVKRNLVKPERAIVVDGSGVDTKQFSPGWEKAIDGTFLLVARLLKEKGIEEFVAAARLLKGKYPATHFRVMGPFSRAPTAVNPETVRAWEEEGVIEYLGETEDVRPALSECMVFVLPSYYGEGLPKTSLEALAMGKPVITTDWRGCREAVTDGKNGFLVPIRDANALAWAMERFLEDPNLAHVMGKVSRCIAEERFDVRRVNEVVIGTLLE